VGRVCARKRKRATRSVAGKSPGAGEEHERRRSLRKRTGVGRARRGSNPQAGRAQDSRRWPAAEAGAVPAVRLSLLVDAAGVGTLLRKR
jgi:hypothetical protein